MMAIWVFSRPFHPNGQAAAQAGEREQTSSYEPVSTFRSLHGAPGYSLRKTGSNPPADLREHPPAVRVSESSDVNRKSAILAKMHPRVRPPSAVAATFPLFAWGLQDRGLPVGR